ncbi:MAG: FHA domain-containing protein [Actinomycetaceae bacterium]|nr:FHA domain-containing protein [Actinomycetaceae bacterium]
MEQQVFYKPASGRRRRTASLLSALILLIELAAAALPIIDAGFPSFSEQKVPFIAAGAILLILAIVDVLFGAITGALPGLQSTGVISVRVNDGSAPGLSILVKYLLMVVVGICTVLVGLALILRVSRDELGRTWFDRFAGLIVVDTRQPYDEDELAANASYLAQSENPVPEGTHMDPVPALRPGELLGGRGNQVPLIPTPPPVSAASPAYGWSAQPGVPGAAPYPMDPNVAFSGQSAGSPAAFPVSAASPLVGQQPAQWSAPSAVSAGPAGVGGEVPAQPPNFPAQPGAAPVFAARARLIFDDGTVRYLNGTLVLGRNPAPDPAHQGADMLPITDPSRSVSKTHVALTLRDGMVLVEDLRSTNGTVVVAAGGEPQQVTPGNPVWARDGDSVILGGRRLKVGMY